MVKQDNKNSWIAGIIVIILIYGGSQGWFNSITNNFVISNQDSSNTETNYYCCSYANGYSCSLNGCPSGSSKVYADPFNTLSACNSKCVTPQIFQPQQVQPSQSTQTCQQIATSLGASYKNTPVSTAKECMDFATLDCQDTGKILDGYGIQGDCCYFTCIAIVTPEPVICSNTDSGLSFPFNLQTTGACTDDNGYFEDNCDNGMLNEYYCEPGINNGPSTCGHVSYNCEALIPGTTCQNGRCI